MLKVGDVCEYIKYKKVTGEVAEYKDVVIDEVHPAHVIVVKEDLQIRRFNKDGILEVRK